MSIQNEFVRELGHLLRLVVKVKVDLDGHPMIYKWPEDSRASSRRQRRSVPIGGEKYSGYVMVSL